MKDATSKLMRKTARFRWSWEPGGDLITLTVGVAAAAAVNGVIGHSAVRYLDLPEILVVVYYQFGKSGTGTGECPRFQQAGSPSPGKSGDGDEGGVSAPDTWVEHQQYEHWQPAGRGLHYIPVPTTEAARPGAVLAPASRDLGRCATALCRWTLPLVWAPAAPDPACDECRARPGPLPAVSSFKFAEDGGPSRGWGMGDGG